MTNYLLASEVEHTSHAQNFPAFSNEAPVKILSPVSFTEEGESFTSDPYLDYEVEELYKFLGIPPTEQLSRVEKIRFEMEMANLNQTEISF